MAKQEDKDRQTQQPAPWASQLFVTSISPLPMAGLPPAPRGLTIGSVRAARPDPACGHRWRINFYDQPALEFAQHNAILQEVQTGIATVWNKHFPDRPTEFKLNFFERFEQPGRVPFAAISAYVPSTDTILIALQTMLEQRFANLPLDLNALFYGAHEGFHRVQKFSGLEIIPSEKDPHYPHTATEDRAVRVAMDVIKSWYPEAQGDLVSPYGTVYQVPAYGTY